MTKLSNAQHQRDLERAFNLFQTPSLTAQLADFVGSPLEAAVAKLPAGASRKVQNAIVMGLHKAFDGAIFTMRNRPGEEAWTASHKLAAAACGAVGGFFGFTAMAVELPLSTVVMARAIADVANSEGFDLEDYSTKEACVAVFTLGGPTPNDDASETGYFMARSLMRQAAATASAAMARVAAGEAGKDAAASWAVLALAELIQTVAARLGVVVTQKAAAMTLPVVGALGAGSMNALFTDHFQDMARAYFIMHRLEGIYGEKPLRQAYDALKKPRVAAGFRPSHASTPEPACAQQRGPEPQTA